MNKLFFCLALSLACLLCLPSCGGEPKKNVVEKEPTSASQSFDVSAAPLELEQKNSVADWADFTLVKIDTTKKVEGSLNSGSYYENSNAGETYVDVILNITNTNSQEIHSDDIATLTAVSSSGTEYTDTINAVETDSGKYVAAYEPITPLSTVRLHCAVSVPEQETDLTLHLDVNGSPFTCSYTLGDTLVHSTPLAIGTKLTAEDFGELVFQGTEYTDDLLPSNPSGFYTHYAVDSPDSTYLAVRFDLTNLQSTSRDADTFAGVKACFMGKYTYTGFLVVEDTDGTGFSAYESLDPLTCRHAVVLIEVPKTVADQSAVITLSFHGQEYTYTVTP